MQIIIFASRGLTWQWNVMNSGGESRGGIGRLIRILAMGLGAAVWTQGNKNPEVSNEMALAR